MALHKENLRRSAWSTNASRLFRVSLITPHARCENREVWKSGFLDTIINYKNMERSWIKLTSDSNVAHIVRKNPNKLGFFAASCEICMSVCKKMNSMDYLSFQPDGYEDWKSWKLQLDKSRSPRFNLFNHFSLIKLLSFTNLKIPEM